MTLLFASSNSHKIQEIRAVLPSTISLLSLADIGFTGEIPEPGTTIRENSLLKADYMKKYLGQSASGMSVFADDSGLEVTALGNAPGVYSARFAGVPKNDAANNAKLLNALQNVIDRRARFVTTITLLIKNEIHVFEGEIKGTIAYEARGKNGFGYDPLFIPQGYRSTFAELGNEIKNEISHRALAVKKLAIYLNNL